MLGLTAAATILIRFIATNVGGIGQPAGADGKASPVRPLADRYIADACGVHEQKECKSMREAYCEQGRCNEERMIEACVSWEDRLEGRLHRWWHSMHGRQS